MTAFLVDEMFPIAVAELLRTTYSHDAVHVAEIGLRATPDTQVAAAGRAEGRAVVTENVADYAAERDLILVFTLAMAVRHPSTQAALNALLKPPLAGGGPIRLSNGFVASLDLRLGDFINDNAERVVLEGDALDGAAFNGADLSGACLFGASVNGTMFQGAKLDGADLSGIKNLKDAQTDETTEYDQYTKWPKGFTKQDQMKFGTEKVSTLKSKEAACP